MRVIKSLHPKGFLSYPPDSEPVELGDLNLIIGANGSGKSNLVEALDILRAAPGDLPLPIHAGGGIREWLWRGQDGATVIESTLDVVFEEGAIAHSPSGDPAVRYRLSFGAAGDHFVVMDERIENELPRQGESRPYFYFGYERGTPMINAAGERRSLRRETIDQSQSILSQRKDPDQYPELFRLARVLNAISIYRNWQFGPDSAVRIAGSVSVRGDRLEEALTNLPVRIGQLKAKPALKARLLEVVSQVAESMSDVEVVLEGGRLQLYVTEGQRNFAARRLSDGTLRMLCLAAILLDPVEGSILVIEEPELGLHPDLMPLVRDLLLEASERAQVIVTTHSTVLADAFTEHAECVLVCDKEDGQTRLSRLSQEDVDRWKSQGGLGSLWMSGQLGGTRW